MKAVVLEKFGGPEELKVKEVPVPGVGDNDVLIKVQYAGIGQWDSFEREGGYDEMLGLGSTFPYILGSEGSGVVQSKGKNVHHFSEGDKVYASGFLNPKGGFYAEFAAVDAQYVLKLPDTLSMEEAGSIFGAGLTALRGIEDILRLKKDESLLILGASGGVGHLSVQLAKQIGAKVFAVASGEDGVSMVKTVGADEVVNGRSGNIVAAAQKFTPDGFDAALFTTGGEIAQSLIGCIRPGGRVAYPNGVYPLPEADSDITMTGYNGEPDADILERLNERIKSGNVHAHIDHAFSLEEAYEAHQALNKHYVGKLCFKIKHSDVD